MVVLVMIRTKKPGDTDDPPKTFTQEELDEIVKKRLERERNKSAEQYGDYDDVKAKLAEYEKAEEERKKTRNDGN